MTFGKISGILVLLGFIAAGSANAGEIHKKAGLNGEAAAKSVPAPIRAQHIKPQVPIVMGRSVTAHYKTKLHHVKMQPLEAGDTTVSASSGAR